MRTDHEIDYVHILYNLTGRSQGNSIDWQSSRDLLRETARH